MTTRPKISRCRSCGAEVVWAITRAGKRMILDAKPQRLFMLGLSERGRTEREISVAGDRHDAQAVEQLSLLLNDCDDTPACRQVDAYMPHWATCPNADQHRRGKQ